MTKPEIFFNNENYKHLKFFMKIVGIWPYQSIMKNCVFFTITELLSISILIPEAAKMVEDITDIDEVFECLPTIVVGIFCAENLFGTGLGIKKLRKCMDKIMEDWSTFVSDEELNILDDFARYGNKLGMGYFAYMCTTAFFFILQPIIPRLSSSKLLNISAGMSDTIPFHVSYGVDMETYYVPIIIHCYVGLYTHMVALSAINFTYTSFIQHACGIFLIIGYRLENNGKNNDLSIDLNPLKSDDEYYYKAFECLRLHIKAIEFCDHLESTFTTTFFFSLGFNMLALTLAGIQATMHLDDIQEAMRYIVVYIAVLCQLFWQSWQAQLLLDYSMIPYECVLRSPWYQTSTRCQRLLILILVRGAIPSKLTAGKIYTLSIETFSTVLRTSMSYFTVLRSMQ